MVDKLAGLMAGWLTGWQKIMPNDPYCSYHHLPLLPLSPYIQDAAVLRGKHSSQRWDVCASGLRNIVYVWRGVVLSRGNNNDYFRCISCGRINHYLVIAQISLILLKIIPSARTPEGAKQNQYGRYLIIRDVKRYLLLVHNNYVMIIDAEEGRCCPVVAASACSLSIFNHFLNNELLYGVEIAVLISANISTAHCMQEYNYRIPMPTQIHRHFPQKVECTEAMMLRLYVYL
ncbi:hypothetical protein CAPTEDRAFT_207272 [Capitella teleta]|uniref:Uncharacterized protein n=1 Tax=Capitella teleta TaxID=283909 RepID=R7UX30_CAPTE|nr:hypothetical protein CAPTEDRAFT_207272 [Capitella teleta]|eukprot:ELU07961.1 hypothetical protein CAPTEDRAFT_207272 [Capitella teleta]